MSEDKLTKPTDLEESHQQKDPEQSPKVLDQEKISSNQEASNIIAEKSESQTSYSQVTVDKEEEKPFLSNETITESNEAIAAELSPAKSENDELQEHFLRLEEKLEEKLEKVLQKVDEIKKELVELKQSLAPSTRSKSRRVQAAEPPINPVQYLHENGNEKLQEELETMTNDQLTKIIRFYTIKKAKDVKSIPREEMKIEIVKYAEQKLNRGSVFLKDR
jgi:hypothetical protein